MSSTRYTQQPLQIYQDPGSSFDRAPMPSSNMKPKKLSPLRPLKNAASRNNIVFNPPQAGHSKQSPHKSLHQTSSSPSRATFNSKLNMITMPPPGSHLYNTDSMEKKPLMSKFKPQKALFTTFPSDSSREKENYPQPSTHYAPLAPYGETLSQANFSLEGLFPRPTHSSLPQKRLLDAAPIHETRPFKRAKMEENSFGEEIVDTELPAPDSFPPLQDDGTKPPHSYATLIGMSILRAPNRRLTLAQIYKWISDTYSFYSATDAGWQNSIRHNLSLNKAFIKQERPKDDPGKGNYWAIQPGMEHQFLKDKIVRKAPGPNENVPVLNANLAPIDGTHEPRFKTLVPAPPELPQPRQPLPTTRAPEPQLPSVQEQEISSDATIPNSDAVATDPEPEEDLREPEPSSPLIQSSPPIAMMHSSPPIPRQAPKRHDTPPPPVPRFDGSSRTRSHKRKYASMDDSGYFSSLESSAMRPHRLISDADRPRIKRGRAEEEIARLRGSSYDSPTKPRHTFNAIPSSSPVRRGQMGPPLTPAIKLKPPTRAPPSVSPNTHLRLHRDRVREMVGSPLRGMTVLEDDSHPWSPAFHLDNNDTGFIFQDFSNDFDIFNDRTSPEKPSAKRPRLDRSRSANILADISSSSSLNKNLNITSTPLLKFTPAHTGFTSPLKTGSLNLSPYKPSPNCFPDSPTKFQSPNLSTSFMIPGFEDDTFFGAEVEEWFSEEVMGGATGNGEGFDLCAGTFQKIGSAVTTATANMKENRTPKMGSASRDRERPGLAGGRSLSNRF